MAPWGRMPNALLVAGAALAVILLVAVLRRRKPGEAPAAPPPAPERVAVRAIAVAAGCARAHLEAAAVTERKLAPEEAERHRAALAAWLSREGLTEALEARERAWIQKPIGTLSEDDLLDASWSSEGLAVLLWALRAVPALPPEAVEAEPGALMERVPAVGSESRPFVTGAALRPSEEIEAAAARAQELYDAACRDEFGARVASRALSIALERRRAFLWLTGDAAFGS